MEEGEGGEGVEFDREEKQQSSRRAQLAQAQSVSRFPSRKTPNYPKNWTHRCERLRNRRALSILPTQIFAPSPLPLSVLPQVNPLTQRRRRRCAGRSVLGRS